MSTSSFVFFLALILSAECIVYQSAQIGGNGGGPYDDMTTFNLLNNEHVFRLENILLWGSDEEPVRAFQGKYAILDVTRAGTQDGRFAGNSGGQDARHFVIISKKEITERAYGYYGSDLTLHGGVHLTNHLGFDVRRTSGSLDFYGAGKKVGANFTILGPIVGFYGGAGGAVDYIGVYVDPSWWPDRPSRLVMLRSGGRSFSDGDDYSFDHNIELGEPFTVRIAQLVIYYGTNAINGLYVVYEDHMRNRIPKSAGNTAGENVTVTFERGDYIQTLEVNNNFGSSGNTDQFCMAGMKVTVYRASTGGIETFIAATEDALLVSNGPIVAFYGLIQSNRSCIARLGGYKLIAGTELSKTCKLPSIPQDLVVNEMPDKIGVGTVLTFSCANPNSTIVTDSVLECMSDGIWDGLFPTCSVPCNPLEPLGNGSIVFNNIYGTDATLECNYGFELDGSDTLFCSNTTWNDEPECTYLCQTPITPANGAFLNTSLWYRPGSKLGYSCIDGYEKGPTNELTCEDDGTWSGGQPVCLVDCRLPPSPTGVAYVNPAVWYSTGSVLDYTCNQGYIKGSTDQLTCEIGGIWSGAAVCKESVCTTPAQPANGSFLNLDDGYPVGHMLLYDCNPGYKITGSLDLQCTATGHWMGAAICSPEEATTPQSTDCPTISSADAQTAQEVWTNCYVINVPGVVIIIALLVLNIVALFVVLALCYKWRLMGSRDNVAFYYHDNKLRASNPAFMKM
jgi:CUB/sushi domain-containing protein